MKCCISFAAEDSSQTSFSVLKLQCVLANFLYAILRVIRASANTSNKGGGKKKKFNFYLDPTEVLFFR